MRGFRERFLSSFPQLGFLTDEIEQHARSLRENFRVELSADFDPDFLRLYYTHHLSHTEYVRRLSLREIAWHLGARKDFHDLAEALFDLPTFSPEGVKGIQTRLLYVSVDAVKHLAEANIK